MSKRVTPKRSFRRRVSDALALPSQLTLDSTWILSQAEEINRRARRTMASVGKSEMSQQLRAVGAATMSQQLRAVGAVTMYPQAS
jgi:hypothetical protein